MKKIYLYSVLCIVLFIHHTVQAMGLDDRISALSSLARNYNHSALKEELSDEARTSNNDLSHFDEYLQNEIQEKKGILDEMNQELESIEDPQVQKNSIEDINEVAGSLNNYINVLFFVRDEIQKRSAQAES